MATDSVDRFRQPQASLARRGRRKRANGEGSIWLRNDGRYSYAAYVLTTAGTYRRVQGYAEVMKTRVRS